MKRFWLWIWIVVLVSLLLTIWLQARYFRPPAPELSMVDPALLELAAVTVQAWNQMIPSEPVERDIAERDPEIEREEWLLRLHDAEAMAAAGGMEIAIAGELSRWILARDDGSVLTGDLNNLRAYMRGLLRWLQPAESLPGGFVVERLALHPEASSSFPALAFEMHGMPKAMGEYLWRHIEHPLGWEVKEMDLNHPDGASDWWLRGSCVFVTRGKE